MRFLALSAAALVLTACGDGSGNGAPALGNANTPARNSAARHSIGGIWEGTGGNGAGIVGLTTETGALHLIDGDGLGLGTLTLSDVDEVNADYTYVAALDTTFDDGSTMATCTLTGTIVERQSLTVDRECTTELGTATQDSLSLTYHEVYNRDSSLATIEGMYDDDGDVLTIDANGELFEQTAPAVGGCTLNGQVSVINPSFNGYEIQFDVDGCTNPDFAELNGTSWSGVAALDDTVAPEELVYGVVGDVTIAGDTRTFALVGIAPRIP